MKNLDFLSPSITLTNFGSRAHVSNIGGFLSIITIILWIVFTIFFILSVILKSNPSFYFFKKNENKKRYIYLNETGIKNYIYLASKLNNVSKIDKKYIRIYAYSSLLIEERMDYNLSINNHWLYDSCDESDFSNKSNEINLLNYLNYSCLKYFYDNQTKQYYSKDDDKFEWPFIGKDNNTDKNSFYFTNIVIEKCTNNSVSNKIYGDCSSENEINNFIENNKILYFFFLDNFIDITNINNPLSKYYNYISDIISNKDDYIQKTLYFNPVDITENKNKLINNKEIIQKNYYVAQINSEKSSNDIKKNILYKIKLKIKGNNHVYKIVYKSIFDVLPIIVALSQLVYYILFYINYIYETYVVINDTKYIILNKLNTTRLKIIQFNPVNEKPQKPSLISKMDISNFKLSPPKEINLQKKKPSKKNSNVSNKSNRRNEIKFERKYSLFRKNVKDNTTKNNDIHGKSDDNSITNLIPVNRFKSIKTIVGRKEGNLFLNRINTIESKKNKTPIFENRQFTFSNIKRSTTLCSKTSNISGLRKSISKGKRSSIYYNYDVLITDDYIDTIREKYSFEDYIKYLLCDNKTKFGINLLKKFHDNVISEESLYVSYLNCIGLQKLFEIENKCNESHSKFSSNVL